MASRLPEFDKEVYHYYQNSCLRCGGWKLLTIHEIVPKSHFGKQGNPFTIENCVPLCENCHDWAHRYGTNGSILELTQHQKEWVEAHGKYQEPQSK